MTDPLNTLLDQAVHARDATLATLLQAEEATRRLRQQSAQLDAYRAEYAQRGPVRTGSTATIDRLRCHRDFMQRLDQALTHQSGQMQSAEGRVVQLRGALLAHETRVASVRKLIERREQEARRVAARQEQRRSDDMAVQRAWRQQAGVAH